MRKVPGWGKRSWAMEERAMRGKRGFWTALSMCGGLFGASAANAGIPVIDAANLTQSILNIVQWGTQQLHMVTEIQNQVIQIQRITGSRNLGQVFNNPLLQQVVPANVSQIMNSVGTQGFSGLTNAAQTIRTASMIYNCMDLAAGPQRAACQAPLSTNAQAQAWQQTGLTTVTNRVQEIQSMQQQINLTQDPKAIAEVQAALTAEAAQVTNDQNRISLMSMQLTAANAQLVQADQERLRAMMVKNTPNISTNVVIP